MTDKSDIKKENMVQALEKTLGIVSTACKACNISRDTHYRWLHTDVDYRAKVLKINSLALDFAESKLFEQIKKGTPAAIIFYLKTKGKSRGYSQ